MGEVTWGFRKVSECLDRLNKGLMLFTMSLWEVAWGSKQVNGSPNEVTWGLR